MVETIKHLVDAPLFTGPSAALCRDNVAMVPALGASSFDPLNMPLRM